MLEIKKAVLGDDGAFDAFNSFSFVFGEGECDIVALSDALMAPPMMTDRKFISVFFAALDSLKENQQYHQKTALLDLLREFADDQSNVVVISANGEGFNGMDGKYPSSFLKEMQKISKCVEFPYQTEARLLRWMERHFAGYGLTADTRLMRSILDICGRSMYCLTGEIAKVAAHAAAAGKIAIGEDDIAACVIKNDEDDPFGLSNCLTRGDTAGALSQLHIKVKMREEPIFVLGQISRAFSDMSIARAFIDDGRDVSDFIATTKMANYRANNAYRAANTVSPSYLAYAMDLCREADVLIKSGVSGYLPLERLICLASRKSVTR